LYGHKVNKEEVNLINARLLLTKFIFIVIKLYLFFVFRGIFGLSRGIFILKILM